MRELVRRGLKKNYDVYAIRQPQAEGCEGGSADIAGLISISGKEGLKDVSRIYVPFSYNGTLDILGEGEFFFYGNRDQFLKNRNNKDSATIFERYEKEAAYNISLSNQKKAYKLRLFGGPIEIPFCEIGMDAGRNRLLWEFIGDVTSEEVFGRLLLSLEPVCSESIHLLPCPPDFKYMGIRFGGVLAAKKHKTKEVEKVIELQDRHTFSVPMGGMQDRGWH